MKIFRSISLILVFIILIGTYFFTKYESGHYLTHKVLHIKEEPHTLQIKNFGYFGLTGSRLEYYISISKNDLIQLLSGRKYRLSADAKAHFDTWQKKQTHPNFSPELCYTSGDLSNGLVNIFVNEDNSEAYIIYESD